MMKYVMTTSNRPDRLRQFRHEMNRIWWPDVREFIGIDWEQYTKEHQFELKNWAQVRHVGNFMSHILILKDALDNWYTDIIIMEDDLILSNFFKSRYERAMKDVPQDREMLRLSWFPSPKMVRVKTESDQRLEDTGPRGTEMYRVRWEGIRKLYDYLSSLEPTCPIDWVIHKAPVKSYMTAYSLWMQWDNYVN